VDDEDVDVDVDDAVDDVERRSRRVNVWRVVEEGGGAGVVGVAGKRG